VKAVVKKRTDLPSPKKQKPFELISSKKPMTNKILKKSEKRNLVLFFDASEEDVAAPLQLPSVAALEEPVELELATRQEVDTR